MKRFEPFLFTLRRVPDNESEQLGGGGEKATLGLARVGSRTALSFAFAFLRRAWRSGEDQVKMYIKKRGAQQCCRAGSGRIRIYFPSRIRIQEGKKLKKIKKKIIEGWYLYRPKL